MAFFRILKKAHKNSYYYILFDEENQKLFFNDVENYRLKSFLLNDKKNNLYDSKFYFIEDLKNDLSFEISPK